ncbi:beta-lactamase-like protein [Kalaharituber pfeilii]|nr:beta-lactamase-like protein [Kalaharituber pfeilii]
MFHFTPLLGAQADSHAQCSLLELDGGINILVDVGWDDKFDVAMLKEIERVAPQLSLILLTHPTISHIGAYAHCCKYIPYFTSIPVYSTFPISALGRLLLTDLYISNPLSTPRLPPPPEPAKDAPPSSTPLAYDPDWLLPPPTPSEIASYFSQIHLLKYSQPHHPLIRTPPAANHLHHHHHHSRNSGAGTTQQSTTLTITAYAAGHTLGGTIWKITHSQESIVYAVSWNHTRENHLSGAAFLSHASAGSGSGGSSIISSSEGLGRPTALICSSRTADEDLFGASKWTRKKRDEALLDVIRSVAVGKGKVVLIPTDSVARVLELIYLLEHAFRKDRHLSGGGEPGAGAGLYLVGRKSKHLVSVVSSMLEWMDETVIKELESSAGKNAQQTTQQGQQQQQQDGGNVQGQGQRGRKGNRKGGSQPGGAGTGGSQQQGGQGQQQQQSKATGPFDFLHMKVLSNLAQLDKLLSVHSSASSVDEDGDTNIDEPYTPQHIPGDSDSEGSVASMDYDPETGALIEWRRPKAQKVHTRLQNVRKKGKAKAEQQKQQHSQQQQHRGLVIIASDTSLEWGFAREVFTKIAGGEGNVIVLTELMDGDGKGGLGEELAKAWREGLKERREKGAAGGQQGEVGVQLGWDRKEIQLTSRTPLTDAPLDAYKKYLSSLKKHSTLSGATPHDPSATSPLIPSLITSDIDPDTSDTSSSETESDSDPDKQGKSLLTTTSKSKKALAAAAIKAATAATASAVGGVPGAADTKTIIPVATITDLGISVLLRGKGVFDFDVRNAKGRSRMLPFALKRRRGDEYGEVVKGEEFLRADEREEAAALPGTEDKATMLAAGKEREKERIVERVMGRKRKWEDAGAGTIATSAAGGMGRREKGKGKRVATTTGKNVRKGSQKRRKQSRTPSSRQGTPYSDRETETATSDDEEGEVKEDTPSFRSRDGAGSDMDTDTEEDSESESVLTTPSKLSTRKLVLGKIRCRVQFIDFSGLHDARSLRMLLPLINPRKLILVAGTRGQVERMAGVCRELLAPAETAEPSTALVVGRAKETTRGTDIFTPRIRETVNASVDTNAWTVKLSERLVRSLKWQEVGGLGVVHVVGRIVASDNPLAIAAATGASQEPGKKRKMLEEQDGVAVKHETGDAGTVVKHEPGGGGVMVKHEPGVLDHEGDTTMIVTSSPTSSPSPDPGLPTTEDTDTKLPPRMLDLILPGPTLPPGVAAAAYQPPTSATPSVNALFPLRHLSTPPIHVGDIKLTDLRRVLTAAGHTAEFGGEGGALVCDGVVVVRKIGVGRVVVEDGGGGLYVGVGGGGGGAAGGRRASSFVEVRRKVYEGLAVVRGGLGGKVGGSKAVEVEEKEVGGILFKAYVYRFSISHLPYAISFFFSISRRGRRCAYVCDRRRDTSEQVAVIDDGGRDLGDWYLPGVVCSKKNIPTKKKKKEKKKKDNINGPEASKRERESEEGRKGKTPTDRP